LSHINKIIDAARLCRVDYFHIRLPYIFGSLVSFKCEEFSAADAWLDSRDGCLPEIMTIGAPLGERWGTDEKREIKFWGDR
jgi:hypothetical protein